MLPGRVWQGGAGRGEEHETMRQESVSLEILPAEKELAMTMRDELDGDYSVGKR